MFVIFYFYDIAVQFIVQTGVSVPPGSGTNFFLYPVYCLYPVLVVYLSRQILHRVLDLACQGLYHDSIARGSRAALSTRHNHNTVPGPRGQAVYQQHVGGRSRGVGCC